jgi:mitochondrial cardiolipin hydrolase
VAACKKELLPGRAAEFRGLIRRPRSCRVFSIVDEVRIESRVAFTRNDSVTKLIAGLVSTSRASVDAAMYRFNNPALARVLAEASGRGLRLRLVLDHSRFQIDPTTRSLLETHRLPYRILDGRRLGRSKMHHKFVILDASLVLTGSYNWTVESEEDNYENLIVVHDLTIVQQFQREFEALWSEPGKKA